MLDNTTLHLEPATNDKASKTLNRIKDILCELLNLEFIEDDVSQDMYPEWDSIAYLNIISALEDEFGVQISEKNINNFDSIPKIIREIKHASE